MPKEIVVFGREYAIRAATGKKPAYVITDTRDMAVGDTVHMSEVIAFHWTKDPYGVAQISVELDLDMVREQVKMLDEEREQYEDRAPGRVAFYTEALDRSTLNRLVKLARKVRDDVHGADE